MRQTFGKSRVLIMPDCHRERENGWKKVLRTPTAGPGVFETKAATYFYSTINYFFGATTINLMTLSITTLDKMTFSTIECFFNCPWSCSICCSHEGHFSECHFVYCHSADCQCTVYQMSLYWTYLYGLSLYWLSFC
jgi:hypothetical protein